MRANRRIDGVTLLTAYAVALIALPSRLVFAPLGGAGTPAAVVGLMCLGLWAYFHIQRSEPTNGGRQPVRFACLLLLAAFLASYVAAMVRPIDAMESSTANLGIFGLLGWVGVVMVANDGIASAARLRVLLRRIAALGGALATLGIVQFVTGQTFVEKIVIPGLSSNHAAFALTVRSGLNRPTGTAIHPIEYGAVLTMILPIAIAMALTDTDRNRVRRWFPVLALAFAIPTSISRSALLSAVIGLIILWIKWPKGLRIKAGFAFLGFAAATYVLIPGLIGGLLGLFTTIGEDSSAGSRVGSYAIAWEFFTQSPVVGRGFSTFLPQYRILDNQFLGLLIEVGLVGLIAMLTLLGVAIAAAATGARHAADIRDQQLSWALAGSASSAVVSLATFDGFSFAMCAGMVFLVIGLCGAARRLMGTEDTEEMAESPSRTATSGRK